jgi:hypothetical protein
VYQEFYHFLELPFFQGSVQRLHHIMRDRKKICLQRIEMVGGGQRRYYLALQNTYMYEYNLF